MLSCQRSAFTLPDGVHYLNCAYMAPLAVAVRAAGIRGIDRRTAPHLIRPEDFFDESDHLRCLFSRVVNAPDPKRVAIVPSVSYGLAAVARNVPAARGDNVVVLEEQFPSNVYVWRRLCAERGLELRTIGAPPPDARGRALEWNIRLLSSIDRRTALVSVPHVHWADGTLFDLERVGERARDCDALLAVDGTQSVGAMPFDVQRVRPDALVCAGYKWLLGPYSTGLAWYGPAFDHGTPIEENWITRRGSEAFAELVRYRDEYQPAALRYDVGERSNFVLLPMLVGGPRARPRVDGPRHPGLLPRPDGSPGPHPARARAPGRGAALARRPPVRGAGGGLGRPDAPRRAPPRAAGRGVVPRRRRPRRAPPVQRRRRHRRAARRHRVRVAGPRVFEPPPPRRRANDAGPPRKHAFYSVRKSIITQFHEQC